MWSGRKSRWSRRFIWWMRTSRPFVNVKLQLPSFPCCGQNCSSPCRPSHLTDYYSLHTPDSDMANNRRKGDHSCCLTRRQQWYQGFSCFSSIWVTSPRLFPTPHTFPLFGKQHVNRRKLVEFIGCQNIKMLLESVGWFSPSQRRAEEEGSGRRKSNQQVGF